MTWPDACWFAVDRSKSDLELLTRIISALGGVLVRSTVTRPLPASSSLTLPSPPSPQIAAFLATGACSGYMFYRWFRLDSAARAAVWSLYGRFTAMIFVGCCCGALSCTPFLSFPFFSLRIVSSSPSPTISCAASATRRTSSPSLKLKQHARGGSHAEPDHLLQPAVGTWHRPV
jgi:hypothetical protein